VIVLRSDELLVRIDPAHGGEILDLVDLGSGRQLLGRPPFGSAEPLAGDLDETTWTEAYRGGWQTVLPNAGNACVVGASQHGFHGRASNDPWTASETTASSTRLAWSGHGLHVEKRIAIEDGALAVRYRIANETDAPVPLVALEHLSVGLEILHPAVRIAFPPALAYELSEQTGPIEPPLHAHGWPEIALLDGGSERGDRAALAAPRSRLYVLNGLAEGWAAAWSEARGQGLALSWDVGWFAHCWVWHENRVSPDPWREQGELLVIEPSTVPHSLGLAVARDAAQARVLAPGDVAEPWIVVRPFIAEREPRGVAPDARVRY
jgi:hypothetical protein